MKEQHISVPRTARYHTVGEPSTARAIWIVLHGYGHLARYFLRTFDALADGIHIVAPEGLSRYYIDEAHTRVGATWMTREDREHEIADQITYLDLLTSSIRKQCPPTAGLNVLGFSQGVATACRWSALSSTRMDRLVLWGGSLPPDLGPAIMAARWSTVPVDLVHGEKDTIVSNEVLERSEAKLREAGIRYTVHRFAGAHELDKLMLQRLLTS